MSEAAPESNRAHAEIVNDEMIRQLLHNSMRALLSGLFVAVLVVLVLKESLGYEQPTIWLLVYALIVVVRMVAIKYALGGDADRPARLTPAIHLFTFLSLLAGISWASVLLFLKPDLPLIVQLFLLVVVCGIPIAALSSMSVYPPVFAALSLPVFIGLMAWALLVAPAHNLPFLGLALLYALLLSSSAKSYYHNMRDALLARLRNRELVDKLSRANHELETLAYRDPVTGLSNRRWFQHQLELALQRCGERKSPLALLLIDLDHFKEINDAYGHHVGDLLLQHTAHCLTEVMRREIGGQGHAARYGGDEFVMALSGVPAKTAIHIGELLLDSLSSNVRFGDIDCAPSATIGIAMFPDDARSVDKLTRHADMAMYAAKKLGRNRLHLYNDRLVDEDSTIRQAATHQSA